MVAKKCLQIIFFSGECFSLHAQTNKLYWECNIKLGNLFLSLESQTICSRHSRFKCSQTLTLQSNLALTNYIWTIYCYDRYTIKPQLRTTTEAKAVVQWQSTQLDHEVMGLIPIQCQKKVVSKPCQDRFLHPVLVHYRKNKKNTGSQMGHTQKFIKKEPPPKQRPPTYSDHYFSVTRVVIVNRFDCNNMININ